MRRIHHKNSIYLRLLRLLVFAAVLSGVFFSVLFVIGEYVIERCLMNPYYVERKNNEYAARLQEYVTENQLSSEDSEELTAWVKKQKIISVQLFRDNILTYDSDYLGEEFIGEDTIERSSYEWENFHKIKFTDGVADAVVFGIYFYPFYTYAMIAELLLAFVLFLGIVMIGIRKSMGYIRKLCSEIEILEGGNLEYEITVTGNDELAVLAKSLDDMRRSFRAQVEQEAYLVCANQKMITDMSHDLRTPLTSIMIYTEILKKKKYKDEKQMQEYIEKIDQKTHRMKQLLDRIFEYSLVTSETEIALEGPEVFQTVFYDLLSEMCVYLEYNRFQIEPLFVWEEKKVRVNSDYVIRIFDNITSNIIKYADADVPIKVRSLYTKREAGFSFENQCRELERKEDSTKIGIRNIMNMMEKMNGRCETEEKDGIFKIILMFPICFDC